MLSIVSTEPRAGRQDVSDSSSAGPARDKSVRRKAAHKSAKSAIVVTTSVQPIAVKRQRRIVVETSNAQGDHASDGTDAVRLSTVPNVGLTSLIRDPTVLLPLLKWG